MSKETIKILMVEDDRAHTRLAERTFSRVGLNYEVVQVASGSECLKRLQEENFDIVLLDYYLPDEDGFQILEKIKSHNPLLPVIVFTGRGDEQLAVQAMKLGASDYLVKTMNLSHFDLLLDVVQKTIEDREMKGKIQELERQYQSIAENVNDLIYRYTPDCIFTYVSPSVTKILGYTPEDLIGTPYPELLSDHSMNHTCKAIHEKQMQGVEVEPFVYEVVKKDGSEVQLETHETILKSDTGKIIGVQGVARDVTDRKRLEQRLLHSEKLAVIGQMAAHIAHEIRNPLSTISLNLSLLSDEIDAYPETDVQESESLLDAIQSEVEWMMQILDDYLRYARLPEINLQLEDLNEIVSNLSDFLESEIERANIQLQLDLDSDLPEAKIDEGKLRLVGINLVRNALEAMPQGGILRISTRHTSGQVEFQVADTGVGMNDEQLESAFQPFYSTKSGGTGLGLPYAQEIVHEHGGYIRCESKLDQGTTFTVVIPLRDEDS